MNTTFFSERLELRAPRPDALPTQFQGVANSGQRMASGIVIDLAGTRLAERMPVLSEHRRDAIIGVVTSARIDAGRLLMAGKLFSDLGGTEAAGIAERAKRGAPYQLSVGLFDYRERFLGRNESATVNGKTVVGPASILTGGMVRECSIVTLGADHQAKALLFAHGQRGRWPDPVAIYARRNSANRP